MATLSSNPGSPLSAYAAQEPAALPGPKAKGAQRTNLTSRAASNPWNNLVRPGVSRRMTAPRPQGEPVSGTIFPGAKPTALQDFVGGTLGKAGDLPSTPRAPATLGRMASTLPELPQLAQARQLWMRLLGAGR